MQVRRADACLSPSHSCTSNYIMLVLSSSKDCFSRTLQLLAQPASLFHSLTGSTHTTLHHTTDTMLIHWAMPRYREPFWVEHVINNMLKRIDATLSQPIRGTALEYWLIDPQGQVGSVYCTLILGALIWLIALEYLSRSSKCVAPTPDALKTDFKVGSLPSDTPGTPVARQSDKFAHTPGTGTTSYMLKLAPPGHRPTHAQLKVSPFAVTRSSYPVNNVSPFADTPPLEDRTGRAEAHRNKKLSLKHSQGRHFSGSLKQAPKSYETLQENGMLVEDGSLTKKKDTMTKKKAALEELRELQRKAAVSAPSAPRNQKSKDVKAYWANDPKSKGERASLIQEADEDEYVVLD